MRFFKKKNPEENGDFENGMPDGISTTQTSGDEALDAEAFSSTTTSSANASGAHSSDADAAPAYVGKHAQYSANGTVVLPADKVEAALNAIDSGEEAAAGNDIEQEVTSFLPQAKMSSTLPEAGAASGAHALPPMTAIGDGFDPGDGKKRMSGGKKALIAICIIVGVLAAAYIGVSVFFMSHFGFNTTIAGEDVSFQTVEEVEKDLSAKAKSYALTINEREDKQETITGSDVKVAYDANAGQVQAVLDAQQPFLWPARFFNKDEGSTDIEFTYDKELLSAAVAGLECMKPESQLPPENAYPEFNGTEYIAHPEVLGTTINVDEINKVIPETVKFGIDTLSLDESGCYVPPEITTESQDLKDRIALLDKYTPFALTYTMPDGSTVVLDGQTVFNWLDINPEDDTYTFREEEVVNWVAGLAGRYDTVGHERVYTSVDGNTYSVSGGTYGWSIDEAAEVEAIKNMLVTKQSETREPIYVSRAAVVTEGTAPDWGDTYIDLGIGSQHMYYIQNGEVIFEADVVTGLPGRDTPQGCWSILEKQQNKVLRGEMTAAGVPEYETPVSYWLRVTWSGVGFHDASWQSSFGGSRYLYVGSHGCINMSYSDVAQLYDLVAVDTPVIIHE